MLYSYRRPVRRCLAVGSLLLAVVTALVAAFPAIAGPPAFPTTQASSSVTAQSSQSSFQLFAPVVTRPRSPLGMIVQPSELLIAKAQSDQGIEPGRAAVRSLLKNAGEALAEPVCAMAAYTTSTGYSCLNHAAEGAYVLAIAYRLTGEPAYSQKSAAFIRAWAGTLTSIDAGDGQSQLDWSRLAPAMIWGADLLAGAPGWTEADRAQLIGMLQTHALAQAKAAAGRANNWADAGNLLWLSIAVYAGLPAERAAAVASWKLKLDGMRQNGAAATDACPDDGWIYGMCSDGSLAEENRRGADGLSYNQGALSVKTVFAEILARQGDSSLYSYKTPRGVGLKSGWDFLAPRAVDAFAGRCTWLYTPDHCVVASNRSGWELAYARWREPAYMPVILERRPYSWSNWADPGYSTVLFGSLNLSGR